MAHGGLAQAGKVKSKTPKVEKQERSKRIQPIELSEAKKNAQSSLSRSI